ncbi:MAG: choice-of-anchor J domain-containing protein [Chitinophagaceae bacterium]|nr:choice-of-anchor J domain-containing protein [Chitinophagaceae bacterium]
MRKVLLLAVAIVSFSTLAISQQAPGTIKVVTGELIRITPALKDIKPDPNYQPPVTRDLTGLVRKKSYKEEVVDYGTKAAGDPVVQRDYFNPKNPTGNNPEGPLAGTKVIQNYDGIGFDQLAPADPCLTNGPNHVIQMVNGSQGSYFKIWDKAGATVIAQTYMDTLFPIVAGDEFWGDPIVMYDQFADRYILSEFAAFGNSGAYANTLIFAVSQTNNPAGSWYVYKFTDNTVFIDYPHYSVWPNAIFGTSNDFNTAGTAYLGSSLMAFDKAKMIAGNQTANMIRMIPSFFGPGVSPGGKPRTVAPVSISGPTAPSAPNAGLFLYYHDDNLTGSATDVDSVGVINMTPDFATPANTVVTIAAQIPVAAFKSNVCASRACIPGGNSYDAISDRFMHRISYRNFGGYEAIVANHTVDANYPAVPARAGIRWYEFRKSGGNWGVQQQGTYSPDGDGRWMGGIAINSKGQIALAFNTSGVGKFASIHFTGRNSTDPPGAMVYDEGIIQTGTAYGTFGNRWGDYNDLETDVTNDSVFWYTAMYGATNWRTRVASIKLEPLAALDARLFSVNNPLNGQAQCDSVIVPQITIRNAGTAALTTLNIYTQLNGGAISAPYVWNGTLNSSESALVTLPTINAIGGSNTLRVFTNAPNGGTDENSSNDTTTVTFTILKPIGGPVSEGFESVTFPPTEWRVINANAGSMTFRRTTRARKTGTASAWMEFYNYGNAGHIDHLLAPLVEATGADSIIFSFERAYRFYGPLFSDTLEVVLSTDCGATFTSIWKRGGTQLATVPGTFTGDYIAAAADWLQLRLDLKPFVGNATSFTVGFRTKNGFGQNLYIDDVNIIKFVAPLRDATVTTVVEPSSRLCARAFTPRVEIGSLGKDTLKSVKIMYRFNSNPLDSVIWTGSLSIGNRTFVNLKPVTLTAGGNYTFTVYTKEPNGSTDQLNSNDTLRTSFTVFDPIPAPVKEGFEQATFPPANWALSSSGSPYTWQRTTRGASEKTASAWIRNYRFNSAGKKDDLYSPVVQITNPDSVYLHFDIAHVTARFPGSTATPLDTLEVLLTLDCGKTFRSVYKKWGEELSTVDRNFPSQYPVTDTVGFVPGSKENWRTEWVDVSKFVAANSKFQFVFRSTSNKGNNLFLDNIDISTITLPARLKQKGYLISPNPFEGAFVVRHLLPPTNLRGIQVLNSVGQAVVSRSFSGNASNYLTIDLGRYANGVYEVKLIYDNKVITERIIKRK